MLFILILFLISSCCFAMEEGQRPKQQVIDDEQKAIEQQLSLFGQQNSQVKKNKYRLLSTTSSDSEEERIVFGQQNKKNDLFDHAKMRFDESDDENNNNNNNSKTGYRNQQVVQHANHYGKMVWRVKNGKQEKDESKTLAQPVHNQISKKTVTDAKAFMKSLDELPAPIQKEILQYAFGEFVQQDIKVAAWRLPLDLVNPLQPLVTEAKHQMLNPTFTNLPDSHREDIALKLYLLQEPNAVEYMKGIQACVDKGEKCTAQELVQSLYKMNDRQFIKDKFGLLYKIQGNETFFKAKEMLAKKNGVTEPIIHGVRHISDDVGISLTKSCKINTKNVDNFQLSSQLFQIAAVTYLGAKYGGQHFPKDNAGKITGGLFGFLPSLCTLALAEDSRKKDLKDLLDYNAQAEALEKKRLQEK